MFHRDEIHGRLRHEELLREAEQRHLVHVALRRQRALSRRARRTALDSLLSVLKQRLTAAKALIFS